MVVVASGKRVAVSTHSRAEGAAFGCFGYWNTYSCFNTQPRGGGCIYNQAKEDYINGFNTQPRGGGCESTYHVRAF